MKIDIQKLSLHELDLLVSAAEQRKRILATRRSPAVVRKALIDVAAAHGYSIGELFDIKPTADAARKPVKRRKLAKVAAKYRDPDNKRNTWSGRGRMPRWLVEKTKRGRNAADFLIPGLARPTAKKSSAIGQRSVYKQG